MVKHRIACVGDSITYGFQGKNVQTPNNYPAHLQQILGNEFEVFNFGMNECIVQKNGQKLGVEFNSQAMTSAMGTQGSYRQQKVYKDAISCQPDTVVFMLGTFDCKSYNWNIENFKNDYKELLKTFQNLRTQSGKKCEVFVMIPPPLLENQFMSLIKPTCNVVLPDLTRDLASKNKIRPDQLINIHGLFLNNINLYYDKIHPNQAGHQLIAQTIASKFKGEIAYRKVYRPQEKRVVKQPKIKYVEPKKQFTFYRELYPVEQHDDLEEKVERYIHNESEYSVSEQMREYRQSIFAELEVDRRERTDEIDYFFRDNGLRFEGYNSLARDGQPWSKYYERQHVIDNALTGQQGMVPPLEDKILTTKESPSKNVDMYVSSDQDLPVKIMNGSPRRTVVNGSPRRITVTGSPRRETFAGSPKRDINGSPRRYDEAVERQITQNTPVRSGV